MADIVPHALAGDAPLFGNLGEGEILIVVEAEAFTLLIGQQVAVEVQEHALHESSVVHSDCLPVKQFYLSEYSTVKSKCQAFYSDRAAETKTPRSLRKKLKYTQFML